MCALLQSKMRILYDLNGMILALAAIPKEHFDLERQV
jgi:hypothetical protein